ncbi:MAG: 30S ribosomal protein S16 [Myxococcales bacterium]|nr:30S ribosomal protein S16 [Myxococcales bacterium]
MAVKIRCARHGSKKRPFYRVVAADRRFARDGRFIELLGTYDPNQEPATIDLKMDRVNYWLENGAETSPTAKQIIKTARTQAAE